MIIGSLSIVSISLLFENPAAFIILESESNFTRRVSNLFKICFPRFLNFPFSQLKKYSTEFFEMRILLIMIIMLMLLLLEYCIFRTAMLCNVLQCSRMFCNVLQCCIVIRNASAVHNKQENREESAAQHWSIEAPQRRGNLFKKRKKHNFIPSWWKI